MAQEVIVSPYLQRRQLLTQAAETAGTGIQRFGDSVAQAMFMYGQAKDRERAETLQRLDKTATIMGGYASIGEENQAQYENLSGTRLPRNPDGSVRKTQQEQVDEMSPVTAETAPMLQGIMDKAVNPERAKLEKEVAETKALWEFSKSEMIQGRLDARDSANRLQRLTIAQGKLDAFIDRTAIIDGNADAAREAKMDEINAKDTAKQAQIRLQQLLVGGRQERLAGLKGENTLIVQQQRHAQRMDEIQKRAMLADTGGLMNPSDYGMYKGKVLPWDTISNKPIADRLTYGELRTTSNIKNTFSMYKNREARLDLDRANTEVLNDLRMDGNLRNTIDLVYKRDKDGYRVIPEDEAGNQMVRGLIAGALAKQGKSTAQVNKYISSLEHGQLNDLADGFAGVLDEQDKEEADRNTIESPLGLPAPAITPPKAVVPVVPLGSRKTSRGTVYTVQP